MKAEKDITAASKNLQSKLDSSDGDEGTLPEILEMSMPEAFTTELINENFDDLVSQAATKQTLSAQATLEQFDQKLKAAYTSKGDSAEADFFNQLAQSGGQSWQGNVPLSSTSGKSFEEVYAMAEANLLAKIPGKLVKAFTVQAEKALGFCVFFSLKSKSSHSMNVDDQSSNGSNLIKEMQRLKISDIYIID